MGRGHPRYARYYARVSPALERSLAPHRRALLAGLSGRVVEVGAGNGLNFPHYPPAVTEVLAVEPEPLLRSLAEASAARAAVSIKVVDGVAEDLPAGDASFDAAVTCLVLCTVTDQAGALAELRRVLRPGGELRFLEHVRAESAGRRRVQRVLDATVFPLLVGGCHCGRDTAAAIEAAGFTIGRVKRLGTADTGIPFPSAPQLLGAATSGSAQ
ncbi:class I SAM-dependent methyltransferase [Acrocarpospora catenulata]|uniref:class I SAM-dependent methyltransferase n=1 Tax=Acrocarpospora catenulata TaxID=2836182 RepID=UPI001BDA994F|nr:class I SAM-dependent methyltransferase [Acrocarpospora catenulata]